MTSHNEILRRDLVAEWANLGIYQFPINIEETCILNLQPTYFCLYICIVAEKKVINFNREVKFLHFCLFFSLNKSYSLISIIFCNEWLLIFIINNSTHNPANITPKRLFSLQGLKLHLLLKADRSLNKVIIIMVYPIQSWVKSIMDCLIVPGRLLRLLKCIWIRIYYGLHHATSNGYLMCIKIHV